MGSDNGSSLSHLAKARTAKVVVVGMCWVNHGLTVEGQTNRLEGSNVGVGGAGHVEFMSALWMGVVEGLDADGPVLAGVEVSPVSSPARWRNSAN